MRVIDDDVNYWIFMILIRIIWGLMLEFLYTSIGVALASNGIILFGQTH